MHIYEKIADELNLKTPEQSPEVIDAAVENAPMENNDGDKGTEPLLIDKLIDILPPGQTPQPINSDGSEENPDSSTAGYKTAGLLDTAMYAGKALMKSTTLRNAAIGAGIGAIGGAMKAPQGQGLKGALKGAVSGGLLAGAGTMLAKGIATPEFKNAEGLSNKLTALKGSFQQQGQGIMSLGKNVMNYHNADETGKSIYNRIMPKMKKF